MQDRPVAVADAEKLAPQTIMRQQVAPPASTDRFPIIIGAGLTMAFVSSAMRAALTGYRLQLVDVLSELLEHEGHGQSVLSKRMIALSGARFEYVPADSSDRAKTLCDEIGEDTGHLPMATIVERLGWHGLYFGLACEELIWERGERWRIGSMDLIHSRRLSYPDWLYWDLHIWDQGIGGGLASDAARYGVRIADYPGKFFVWQPQVRGEYAGREGLGRGLATLFLLKRLVLRVTASEFERFVKPWCITYFSTADQVGHHRVASEEDIAAAELASGALGTGSLTAASLPDSVKVELLRAASSLDNFRFAEYLDGVIARFVLGQTSTSTEGKFGSRSASEVAKEEQTAVTRADAAKLARPGARRSFRRGAA